MRLKKLLMSTLLAVLELSSVCNAMNLSVFKPVDRHYYNVKVCDPSLFKPIDYDDYKAEISDKTYDIQEKITNPKDITSFSNGLSEKDNVSKAEINSESTYGQLGVPETLEIRTSDTNSQVTRKTSNTELIELKPTDSNFYNRINSTKNIPLSTETFYATNPKSVRLLLKELDKDGVHLPTTIHEPACGKGHISETLKEHGYNVVSSDLYNYGYGTPGVDFLTSTTKADCFFTNPPHKKALEFVEKSIENLNPNGLSVMMSTVSFLATTIRRKFFKLYPPKYIYIHSRRQACAQNGDFDALSKQSTSRINYAWYIWEKDDKGEMFHGDPIVRWIDMAEPLVVPENNINLSQDEESMTAPKLPDTGSCYNKKVLHNRKLSQKRQKDDFYATDPKSVGLFINNIQKDGITLPKTIHEPACGKGHISEVLKNYGYNVISSDLQDYKYGKAGVDFLKSNVRSDCFFTNPPYKLSAEFLERSISNLNKNGKIVMYLTLNFLSGSQRSRVFKLYPPKYIYLHSKTQHCLKNGNGAEFPNYYAWYIWEKDDKGEMFHGDPIFRWIDET